MIRMTAREYQAKIQQEAEKKRSKHRNRYVYVYEDGFFSHSKELSGHGNVIETYASVKEHTRKCELDLLLQAGRISELERQKLFLLREGFVDGTGKRQRPIWYRADFVYKQDGKTVIEDVKGVDRRSGQPRTTEGFRIKWKMMKEKYPEYEYRIY